MGEVTSPIRSGQLPTIILPKDPKADLAAGQQSYKY
jgi:hypothetical protein